MDETMEIVQHKYKSMDFPGNEDSFEIHSHNMPLTQQCATFAYHQYSRRVDVEKLDAYNRGDARGNEDADDRGNRKSKGIPLKRTQEKILIDEILTLSGIMEETPGRELDADRVWKVLAKVTTKLEEPKKGVPATDSTEQEEENTDELNTSRIVSEMEAIRVQIRSTETTGDEGDHEAPNIETARAVVDRGVIVDEDDEIELSTALLDEEADEEREEEETEEIESIEEDVQVGTTKLRTKKVPISELALKDLYALGRQSMIDMKLPERRLRRTKRKERERKAFHENLFEFLNANDGETAAVPRAQLERAASVSESGRECYELADYIMNVT